jgi:RNA polymerase sigma-70 factor (sigma-E family)
VQPQEAVVPGPRDRGRARGLEELYRSHAQDAVRLAYLITGDHGLAEDLAHDAFVRLAGRLAHLRDPEAFGAYLNRTVVNLARSQYRRQKVQRTALGRVAMEPQSMVTAPDHARREELWTALQAIDWRKRAAIVLRLYEDLSERRVAELLGCRPGTVRSLLSRGLAELRPMIRGEEDE